jgi:hypothetical protein
LERLHLLAGVGLVRRPVVLIAPSPHPEGRVVPVLDYSSTLTFAARYGLTRRVDASLAIPLVFYQSGTGAEGVTAQRTSGVRATTFRDSRLALSSVLYGVGASAPFVVSSRLEVALPLGDATALAGASGPTVAPGFGAELEHGRLVLGLEGGLRIRRAVAFGTVREGSEAVVMAGAGATLVGRPLLALSLEGVVRASLAAPPLGTPADARDLAAEWLLGARFEPVPGGAWSGALGGGSGLPLARSGVDDTATLAVTAPSLRVVASLRYRTR